MNKINVTDARKEMSHFWFLSYLKRPIVLKRRKYEAVLIERNLLKLFLQDSVLQVKKEIDKDKNTILWVEKLNVWGKGESLSDATEDLCNHLKEYANDIYDNFMFYFYGQNIKDKLSYIFHILLCETTEDLKQILVFNASKKTKKTKI